MVKNYEKTGHAVYLNIKRIPKVAPTQAQTGSNSKPTVLGIGVDGGFDVEERVEYHTETSVLLLPDRIRWPVNNELPQKVFCVLRSSHSQPLP